MKRRRLVALVSALVLVVVVLAVFGVVVGVTRTSYGRETLRAVIEDQITSRMRGGTLHLGQLSGNLITGVTIDSIAIRDADDSLFFSAGRTTIVYDPRDLLDRRITIRRLESEHPWVHVKQYENGSWNYKRLFRRSPMRLLERPGPRFGDYVVIDSSRLRDVTFLLTMPWHPADSLRGARRDSAIAARLSQPDGHYRRTRGGFAHTWTWSNGYIVAPRMRIADPDSAGRRFVIDTLHVAESDPPFQFRNIRATVRQLGDSVWVDAPHFDLPGSTGRARGKIVWGSRLPVRYAVRVWGDSVSLSDVWWVYPTLPRTGGGSMVLDIQNQPRNLRVIDYKLTEMDVRTTASRLRGQMTFGVGGPVLIVKDVALEADPVDFDLLRALNGKEFPIDWQGTLTGTVVARGGPVNRFYVDAANVSFHDRHVPGAVSHVAGRGELDILFPAFTKFRGFRAETRLLDLRSIEYLFPEFPLIGGTVAGTATLDSVWLDVRFSNADVYHRNGPGEPSRLTGFGRATLGDEFTTYDVTLQAQPLSLSMLARAYPSLPFKGLANGPIRARGTAENLDLTMTLMGEAGSLQYEGVVDASEPGFRARGRGVVTGLNPARLLAQADAPTGSINARYEVDLAGDSLANLAGSSSIALDRSIVDGLRVYPSTARLRFAGRRLLVDTLRLETVAANVSASGALGLPGGPRDSLSFRAYVDSLGGLRRYITSQPADEAPRGLQAADSLTGSLDVAGVARGTVQSVDVEGTVSGRDLRMGGHFAEWLRGRFAVRDIAGAAAGSLAFRLDTAVVASVRLDSAIADVVLRDRAHGIVGVRAYSVNGPSASARAAYGRNGRSAYVALDSLRLAMQAGAWRLAGPTRLIADSAGTLTLEPLVLRGTRRGVVSVRGVMPQSAGVRVDVTADSIALEQIAELFQLPSAARGLGFASLTVRGTRAQPVVALDARLVDVGYAGTRLERLDASAQYAARRATATMALRHAGRVAVSGDLSLPIELTLFDARLLDQPLAGRVVATGADFAIIEAFSPALRQAKGTLVTNLAVGGTWRRPTLGGTVSVAGGELDVQPLGIRLRSIAAALTAVPGRDSVSVQVSAASGVAGSMLSLGGFVAYADRDNPRLDLRLDARNFRVIDRRSVASLYVSTARDGLELSGPLRAATLTGALNVDRGAIYIPETFGKDVVPLSGEDFFAIVDTTDLHNRGLLPGAPSELVEHLRLDGVRINLGDDVWLRSEEVNVKLGGSLSVTRAVDPLDRLRGNFARGAADDTVAYRLALEGTLSADRGTYTLQLGPAVQREFQVQRGTITFFGTPDLNPALDITALYTVRRHNQQPIGIRARLSGDLYPQPVLTLESNETFQLSQSDLVSYLVTGQPSFELGERADQYAGTAANVVLPTLGTQFGRLLQSQFGDLIDWNLRFEAGAAETSQLLTREGRRGLNDFLYGARLGGEKEVLRNVYFSVSTGLCGLAPNNQAAEELRFTDALGGKLEYRLQRLSVEAGIEPPSSARLCGRGGVRGFVQTPRQFGISLSRSWQF
ncbi:MAG: translocation/assembly module TamB domain-containing protein [Gemmatimonadaceae bacterium]